MKKLFFKILLFSLPILIIFSYPLFVMQAAGEFITADQILSYQGKGKDPCLILTAYSDPWSYVKLKYVQEDSPEVLVIGTSRVMQFRSNFFRGSFYNASRGISDLNHLNTFLRRIPKDKSPKIIILGLDPNMLNPNWIFTSTEELFRKPTWKEFLRIFFKNWGKLYQDELDGKIHVHEVFDEGKKVKKIGLLARAEDEGFINDGSFVYGDYFGLSELTRSLKRTKFYQKAEHDIRENRGIYVSAEDISKERLKELENFLKEASRRKIHVVAYLPPFSPTIYSELLNHKDRYEYLWKLEDALKPLFEKYKFRIFDFQNPYKLNAVDDDFIDDVHDVGRITFRIFLKMVESDKNFENLTSDQIEQYKSLVTVNSFSSIPVS